MSTLANVRNLPGARVLADAGCSWGAVLQETLKEGATPAVAASRTLGPAAGVGGNAVDRERAAALERIRALIRYTANASQVDLMLEANRRLFEESRALGGKLYPFSAVKLLRAQWRQHYGESFGLLAAAKRCFDPKNVLASGPELF